MPSPYNTTGGYGSPVDSGSVPLNNQVMPIKHGQSSLGQSFVATNATPGTALAYNVQASYSATVPFLYLFNTQATGGKSVWLDYIKIICTTAPASAVNAFYAIILDTAARALSPDNTVAITPVNTNFALASANPTSLQIKAQNNATASAVAAAAAPRLLARGVLGGLPVVGDELIIDFGSDDIAPHAGLTAAQASAPARKVSSSPAFCLCPGTSAIVHLWFPSNATTGLSYELEMSYWERV